MHQMRSVFIFCCLKDDSIQNSKQISAIYAEVSVEKSDKIMNFSATFASKNRFVTSVIII